MEIWDKILYKKEVKEYTTHLFSYTFFGEKNIKSVKGSCSCFTPTFKGNIVAVKYVVKDIPYHLRQFGKYIDGKSIIVTFEDGSTDILKFEFLVTK